MRNDRTHRHTPQLRPAMRSAPAILIFLAIAAVGATGDLLSKDYVFGNLLGDPSLARKTQSLKLHNDNLTAEQALQHLRPQRQVLGGLRFTLSTNPGIVFGRTEIPRWGVLAATALTIGMVVVFFATSPRGAWCLHTALACILAGAVGNLYDRLFSTVALPGLPPIRHHVRDFIDCSSIRFEAMGRTINYPYIFNVADILLVVGVGILILHWLLDRRRQCNPAGTSDRAAKQG